MAVTPLGATFLPLAQVLIPPDAPDGSGDLLGCVVEVAVESSSRWSVKGTVVAVVYRPPAQEPAAAAAAAAAMPPVTAVAPPATAVASPPPAAALPSSPPTQQRRSSGSRSPQQHRLGPGQRQSSPGRPPQAIDELLANSTGSNGVHVGAAAAVCSPGKYASCGAACDCEAEGAHGSAAQSRAPTQGPPAYSSTQQPAADAWAEGIAAEASAASLGTEESAMGPPVVEAQGSDVASQMRCKLNLQPSTGMGDGLVLAGLVLGLSGILISGILTLLEPA